MMGDVLSVISLMSSAHGQSRVAIKERAFLPTPLEGDLPCYVVCCPSSQLWLWVSSH